MVQRIAVVTGGNKGIGFAIVRSLCKELKDGIVYLTSRNEERGTAAVKELQKEGLEPRFHQLDIDSLESIQRLSDFLKETHGGFDILVNNAAIAYGMKDDTPFDIQAKVTIKTNYTGTLNVSHALIPLIRSHGRLCHIASMAGPWAFGKMNEQRQEAFKKAKTEEDVTKLMADFVEVCHVASFVGPMAFRKMSTKRQQTFQKANTEADINNLMADFVESADKGTLAEEGWPETAYGVSKAGVITLTKIQASAISSDTSRKDILINCCCPGYVDTDMSNHKGTKTPDEGAITPVYCVLLPENAPGPQGKHLSDKAVVETW